jgi:hypothetical protein
MTHGALYFFAAVVCSFALGLNTARIIHETVLDFFCWMFLTFGMLLLVAAWVVG